MPRKPLDVRKACGRLFANGKQKAPLGRLVLALCLNTARRGGSRQAERGINSPRILYTHNQLKVYHFRLFHILNINRVRYVFRIKGKALTFVKAHRFGAVVDDYHFIVKQPNFRTLPVSCGAFLFFRKSFTLAFLAVQSYNTPIR